MTRDVERGASGGDDAADADADAWTADERALLDAALEFYGAAEGAIDFSGPDPPRVRQDAAAFDAIRSTMSALERCVRSAHASGVGPERIAEVTRIEPEIVALILQRGDGNGDGDAPSPPGD